MLMSTLRGLLYGGIVCVATDILYKHLENFQQKESSNKQKKSFIHFLNVNIYKWMKSGMVFDEQKKLIVGGMSDI